MRDRPTAPMPSTSPSSTSSSPSPTDGSMNLPPPPSSSSTPSMPPPMEDTTTSSSSSWGYVTRAYTTVRDTTFSAMEEIPSYFGRYSFGGGYGGYGGGGGGRDNDALLGSSSSSLLSPPSSQNDDAAGTGGGGWFASVAKSLAVSSSSASTSTASQSNGVNQTTTTAAGGAGGGASTNTNNTWSNGSFLLPYRYYDSVVASNPSSGIDDVRRLLRAVQNRDSYTQPPPFDASDGTSPATTGSGAIGSSSNRLLRGLGYIYPSSTSLTDDAPVLPTVPSNDGTVSTAPLNHHYHHHHPNNNNNNHHFQHPPTTKQQQQSQYRQLQHLNNNNNNNNTDEAETASRLGEATIRALRDLALDEAIDLHHALRHWTVRLDRPFLHYLESGGPFASYYASFVSSSNWFHDPQQQQQTLRSSSSSSTTLTAGEKVTRLQAVLARRCSAVGELQQHLWRATWQRGVGEWGILGGGSEFAPVTTGLLGAEGGGMEDGEHPHPHPHQRRMLGRPSTPSRRKNHLVTSSTLSTVGRNGRQDGVDQRDLAAWSVDAIRVVRDHLYRAGNDYLTPLPYYEHWPREESHFLRMKGETVDVDDPHYQHPSGATSDSVAVTTDSAAVTTDSAADSATPTNAPPTADSSNSDGVDNENEGILIIEGNGGSTNSNPKVLRWQGASSNVSEESAYVSEDNVRNRHHHTPVYLGDSMMSMRSVDIAEIFENESHRNNANNNTSNNINIDNHSPDGDEQGEMRNYLPVWATTETEIKMTSIKMTESVSGIGFEGAEEALPKSTPPTSNADTNKGITTTRPDTTDSSSSSDVVVTNLDLMASEVNALLDSMEICMKAQRRRRLDKLRPPSRLVRNWYVAALAVPLVAYAVYKSRKDNAGMKLAREFCRNAVDFCAEHILMPLKSIYRELLTNKNRQDVTDRKARQDVIESLKLMIKSWLEENHPEMPDKKRLDMATNMDMSLIEATKEQTIKNIFEMNNIVRMSLIEMQFIKKEMMNALYAMDELMATNEINIQLAGITPAFLLFSLTRYGLRKLFYAFLKVGKSREQTYASLRYIVLEIERLLVMRNDPPGCPPPLTAHASVTMVDSNLEGGRYDSNKLLKSSDILRAEDLGMLVLLVHECRTILWKDRRRFSRLELQNVLEDLAELAGERGAVSVRQQLHIVGRMCRTYSFLKVISSGTTFSISVDSVF